MTLYNYLDYIIDNYVASHKPNGRKRGERNEEEESRTSMELIHILFATRPSTILAARPLASCFPPKQPERAFLFLRGESGKKGKPQQQPLSRRDGPLEVKVIVVGSPRGKHGQNDMKNCKFLIGVSISELIKVIKTIVLIKLVLIQTIIPTFFFIGM